MKKPRILTQLEKELIQCLLADSKGYSFDLDNQMVEDMKDGGMGSLYFINDQKKEEKRKMKMCISEKQFEDSDKIPILVSLNIDEDGSLFELDIWKADFSPVVNYPKCN